MSTRTSVPRTRVGRNWGSLNWAERLFALPFRSHGGSQAEAVAQPHGEAPRAAQGLGAGAGHVSALPQPEAAAPGVPGMWDVRRARGAGWPRARAPRSRSRPRVARYRRWWR